MPQVTMESNDENQPPSNSLKNDDTTTFTKSNYTAKIPLSSTMDNQNVENQSPTNSLDSWTNLTIVRSNPTDMDSDDESSSTNSTNEEMNIEQDQDGELNEETNIEQDENIPAIVNEETNIEQDENSPAIVDEETNIEQDENSPAIVNEESTDIEQDQDDPVPENEETNIEQVTTGDNEEVSMQYTKETNSTLQVNSTLSVEETKNSTDQDNSTFSGEETKNSSGPHELTQSMEQTTDSTVSNNSTLASEQIKSFINKDALLLPTPTEMIDDDDDWSYISTPLESDSFPFGKIPFIQELLHQRETLTVDDYIHELNTLKDRNNQVHGDPANLSNQNQALLQDMYERLMNDRYLTMDDIVCVYNRHPDANETIQPDSLEFDSNFECGNLEKVYRVAEREYMLILRFDTYTQRHSQWFYYKVKGMQPNVKYQFHILNCIKGKSSMFCKGMKILVHSEKNKQQGWVRSCEDIGYYQNQYTVNRASAKTKFFTLSFKFTPTTEDVFSFTQAYPYSYTDLQNYLAEKESNVSPDIYYKRDLLCQSVSGKRCDILTITSMHDSPQPPNNENSSTVEDEEFSDSIYRSTTKGKRYVFLSARVHPGETQASYMMKGTLDFLLGESKEAKELRSRYVFKIVPMLNPDGVCAGNNRTNLYGYDLNRTWLTPDPVMHPTVFHFKNAILDAKRQGKEILLFVDMHGHARKKNIFIYGCNSKIRSKRLAIRVFPHVLSKHSILSFEDCKFNLFKSKLSAARCVVFKEAGVQNSYTIEASLCGPAHNRVHFGSEDYEFMGMDLVNNILFYEQVEAQKKSLRSLDALVPDTSAATSTAVTKKKKQPRFAQKSSAFFKNNNAGIEIRVGKRRPASMSEIELLSGTSLDSQEVPAIAEAPTLRRRHKSAVQGDIARMLTVQEGEIVADDESNSLVMFFLFIAVIIVLMFIRQIFS